MHEWKVKVRRGWLEELVSDETSRCLWGPHRVSRMARDGGDGQHGGPAHHLNGFGLLNHQQDAPRGGGKIMSPLHKCLVGSKSNVVAEGRARLLCLGTRR